MTAKKPMAPPEMPLETIVRLECLKLAARIGTDPFKWTEKAEDLARWVQGGPVKSDGPTKSRFQGADG